MNREEELARRLCAYAKIDVEAVFDRIRLTQPEDKTKYLTYDSWEQILFGGHRCFSLFEIHLLPSGLLPSGWFDAWRGRLDMLASLEFSSLEELDLQLSVRGF